MICPNLLIFPNEETERFREGKRLAPSHTAGAHAPASWPPWPYLLGACLLEAFLLALEPRACSRSGNHGSEPASCMLSGFRCAGAHAG